LFVCDYCVLNVNRHLYNKDNIKGLALYYFDIDTTTEDVDEIIGEIIEEEKKDESNPVFGQLQ
jgi:hypothetical protein